MKRTEWAQREERSNVLLLRAMTWISLRFGRRAGRAVLRVVALYFVLFSPSARRASRDYLRRVLGRPARWRDVYRHLFTFGTTIHDRIYLMNGRFDLFDIRLQGDGLVHAALAEGQGVFLMGAHLGSFEVVRAVGRTRPGTRIAVTMYEDNARRINAALAAINPAAKPDIIGLGRVDAMLRVREALDANGMVGMLADRTLLREAGSSVQRMAFLGTPATFPLGPLHMAAMLKRRVLFMTGLYRDGNRYDVHFEALADFSSVRREERAAAVQAALARYVTLLERYCRAAPYNWFNYFDFWQGAETAGPHHDATPPGADLPATDEHP
ncbi:MULTISPECIES: acyl-CoA synthetase [Ralstonia solanacearum species complex]|uniref:Cog4261: predicted acyltransferase protein n=2 Tax=Ralstonia solanacearum TaxID=305 RepID=A0ABF7RBQ3_RALSL|nr:acyl-CoA synthetase [Ralstonia solanacearum]ALF89156.1 lipid A biosynthesis lauroyl acyltransferase [Ralstonia solanacearum]ATI28553.1 acyl-CoA synthetase [Ralstonia solanacearum]EAP73850.1 Dolichol-phosphate mannosyltransferase [Ralstonia solanacearum UW551]KEI31995.1 acyl-CoA synthetase [Ralstonia solanacearum]KFX77063.1 acyl-CoA synthetase [Ralstonia solanacearum]